MLLPTKAIFIQLVITNHTSARDVFHCVHFLYSSYIFNIKLNARIQLNIYIYNYLSNLSYKLQLSFSTNIVNIFYIRAFNILNNF
jgi:hypothetical protein